MGLGKHIKILGASALISTLGLALWAQAGVLDRPFLRANSIVIVFGASDFKENGGVGPVVVDFHVLDNAVSGQAAPDIIGADGVTTEFFGGGYNPTSDGTERTNELLRIENQLSGGVLTNVADFNILDENDSLTEFGIGPATGIDMSTFFRITRFFVTSNTAFDIYAQAGNLQTSGDFTALGYADMRYILFSQTAGGGATGWGSAAQNPAVGGLGRIAAINDLGDMSGGPTKIYDGGRRTARVRGTIMEQAVAFVPIYFLQQGGPGDSYDLAAGVGTIGASITYTIYTP